MNDKNASSRVFHGGLEFQEDQLFLKILSRRIQIWSQIFKKVTFRGPYLAFKIAAVYTLSRNFSALFLFLCNKTSSLTLSKFWKCMNSLI